VKAGRDALRLPLDVPAARACRTALNQLEQAVAGADVPAAVGFENNGWPAGDVGLEDVDLAAALAAHPKAAHQAVPGNLTRVEALDNPHGDAHWRFRRRALDRAAHGGTKKAMKRLKVCEQPISNRPSNKSSASQRGHVGYPIDFAKYRVGLRTYVWPDLKTSKLRVTGSNPVGVANKFNGLALAAEPFLCCTMSQQFSLRFNDSQSLPATPRNMNAT
jgi:hypothetical protein